MQIYLFEAYPPLLIRILYYICILQHQTHHGVGTNRQYDH